MVKLFIGNLPREATEQEIRSLFEQYGKVLECDIIKNYGFVHIEDKTAAEDAIRNLHHHKLHGVCINVEASKNKSKASTKLHVGNISTTCTNLELRAKFEEYGPVIECDIVKDYAFVHMERAEDAVEAIRGLDNTEFQASSAEAPSVSPGWRDLLTSAFVHCKAQEWQADARAVVNQSAQDRARDGRQEWLLSVRERRALV
ncbi:RNA-binding protein 4B isoform X2 [Emys orbicularis]